ncbi:Transposon TX1 uncharacterized 149 kDa protein [Linum perenne]
MFKMDGNRSPGPDGFSANFYKSAWGINGENFTEADMGFFQSSKMLRELNVTSLTLIPKVKNPTQVREYLPISCCSLFYKCIAKILSSRKQLVLPDIISKSQSGFIKNWKIVENILFAQELVHSYNHQGVSLRCTAKVDLMKAFDSVHWEYLFNVLTAMGFSEVYLNWLRACVLSTSYSVLVNEGLHVSSRLRKGLRVRQGGPLSPYFLLLISKV